MKINPYETLHKMTYYKQLLPQNFKVKTTFMAKHRDLEKLSLKSAELKIQWRSVINIALCF